MKEIKRQIKEKQIRGIYLFYGEESYVLHTYLKKVVDTALEGGEETMNYDLFESSSVDLEDVVDAASTLPFLAERRVVVVKDVSLFKKKKLKSLDLFAEFLSSVPESTVLILVEKEIDKRSKLYKIIKKLGLVVEFKTLDENELIRYIANQLAKSDKKIEISTAKHLIEIVGYDLNIIHNELEKLIDFCQDKRVITKKDIDQIATKSVENKIFDLVDCIGTQKRDLALKLYHDLMATKEPPTRILFMITRQFRINLLAKLMIQDGSNAKEVASTLKLPVFIAKKCIQQSKAFSVNKLKQALNHCVETEVKIKSGKVDQMLAIEMLIVEYSG